MKWYKFGFTREWDNLSLEIRNKKISRKKAIKIISNKGFVLPNEKINKFCKYINISKKNLLKLLINSETKEFGIKKIADGK